MLFKEHQVLPLETVPEDHVRQLYGVSQDARELADGCAILPMTGASPQTDLGSPQTWRCCEQFVLSSRWILSQFAASLFSSVKTMPPVHCWSAGMVISFNVSVACAMVLAVLGW